MENKYAITILSGKKRLKRREKAFPKDCGKAFLLGKKLISDKNRIYSNNTYERK